MDLFTEFIRRLSIEIGPIWKWAQKNWYILVTCLIAAFFLAKYWNKRKS